MNYNQLASHNTKIERICHTMAAGTQNKLHRRPTNYNHPTTHQGTRPATICTPRGGQRYKPRPEPRRHHLTHAADMGHTSPQQWHPYKAPCIVPLPGAAAATYSHKPKPPCPVSIYDTKQGGFIFYSGKVLRQDRMESEPCVINRLRNRWDQCQRQICVHS